MHLLVLKYHELIHVNLYVDVHRSKKKERKTKENETSLFISIQIIVQK